MRKKIFGLMCIIALFIGVIYAAPSPRAGDAGKQINTLVAALPEKFNFREVFNISAPVKSTEELVTIIANALDTVCVTLNFSINNSSHWFNTEDEQFITNCIDKALTNSLIGGPYYNGCTYSEIRGMITNSIKMNIKFNYKFPRKILLSYINDVEIKANDIINTVITPDMSDYQREKALHDYIINHCSYTNTSSQNIDTLPNESFTPYGVLIEGSGVCEGYAHAMELLTTKAGLECMVVSGTGDNQPHKWNIIKIGGEYYHVDLTWDDPAGAELLLYNYFNLNDDTISVNHAWDKANYPHCNAMEYNYFKINGLMVNNMDECKKRIKDAIAGKQKSITLKIINFNETTFLKDIKSLLSKFVNTSGLTYYCYEDLGIVEIVFN